MIRLTNRITGTDMWVADDRVKDYLAAGHRLAAVSTEKPKKEPAKKTKK